MRNDPGSGDERGRAYKAEGSGEYSNGTRVHAHQRAALRLTVKRRPLALSLGSSRTCRCPEIVSVSMAASQEVSALASLSSWLAFDRPSSSSSNCPRGRAPSRKDRQTTNRERDDQTSGSRGAACHLREDCLAREAKDLGAGERRAAVAGRREARAATSLARAVFALRRGQRRRLALRHVRREGRPLLHRVL